MVGLCFLLGGDAGILMTNGAYSLNLDLFLETGMASLASAAEAAPRSLDSPSETLEIDSLHPRHNDTSLLSQLRPFKGIYNGWGTSLLI